MTKRQVRISNLMSLVALVAVGFAVLRNPSESGAACFFAATVGVFLLALVGAVARQGNGRLSRLGFSLFGLGYLVFGFLAGAIPKFDHTPASLVLDKLSQIIIPGPNSHPGIRFSNGTEGRIWFDQIGHCLVALMAGLVGSVLPRFFAGTKPADGSPTGRHQT